MERRSKNSGEFKGAKVLIHITKPQKMEDKLLHCPPGFLRGPVSSLRAENTSSSLHSIVPKMLHFIGTETSKMFALIWE